MQNPSADDLRESVWDYRDADTTSDEREQIEFYWAQFEISAARRRAEIEKEHSR